MAVEGGFTPTATATATPAMVVTVVAGPSEAATIGSILDGGQGCLR
jgi:hypothetical protein